MYPPLDTTLDGSLLCNPRRECRQERRTRKPASCQAPQQFSIGMLRPSIHSSSSTRRACYKAPQLRGHGPCVTEFLFVLNFVLNRATFKVGLCKMLSRQLQSPLHTGHMKHSIQSIKSFLLNNNRRTIFFHKGGSFVCFRP